MDRNFARSLQLVLKSEGGWSDNPADPGGATMRGVTLANFRRYVKANGTKDDLRHITDAQLATVYRKFYWDAIGGDLLPDGVDYATFDFAVNSGPSRATRYLQSAVGDPMDGIVGPHTIAAVNSRPAGVIIDDLCDTRLQFLQRLPTWGTFGNGWRARVASVRKEALLMTAQTASPAPVKPIPTPTTQPKVPAAPAPSNGAGIVGFMALAAMAVAGFWHHITAWFHILF
jgi:lysozyme family protein